VFSCVHHRKPGNKHNITDEVVRKEIFLEMGGKDEEGVTLRQRKGYVSIGIYESQELFWHTKLDTQATVPV
jgi:hypothetical protein